MSSSTPTSEDGESTKRAGSVIIECPPPDRKGAPPHLTEWHSDPLEQTADPVEQAADLTELQSECLEQAADLVEWTEDPGERTEDPLK